MFHRIFVVLPIAVSLSLAGDPAPPVVVSAASVKIGVTPNCLAAIYGDKLATQTASASPSSLTGLGDLPFVQIKDSASETRMAALIYVSPSQVNLQIPPDIAVGPATATFPSAGLGPGPGTAALRMVSFEIHKVAPSLFSADGTGTGVAAASAVRIVIPTSIQSPVPVFSCSSGRCVAIHIDTGVDAPVFLSLYGTGIRGASSLSNVEVTIGMLRLKPTYAGAQTQFPGLDQVNVPLPISLRGSGLVDVTVTADGIPSNAVQIAIQ